MQIELDKIEIETILLAIRRAKRELEKLYKQDRFNRAEHLGKSIHAEYSAQLADYQQVEEKLEKARIYLVEFFTI